MTRFAVIRVPGSGPPALIGEPNDFTTEAEALKRIHDIEAAHRKSHHTHLDVLPYEGAREAALLRAGVLM